MPNYLERVNIYILIRMNSNSLIVRFASEWKNSNQDLSLLSPLDFYKFKGEKKTFKKTKKRLSHLQNYKKHSSL